MPLAELIGVAAQAAPTGAQTVPDALVGCWRRNWIQFGDEGERDASVAVIWLQTASGMADLRIDPAQEPTETDSSCGITVVDQTTEPYVTADWLAGESGFSQQPVSSFPEKGWLEWHSSTVMHERAPSGAYVEEWQRLPRDVGVVAHFVALDTASTTNLYVAGNHVLFARRRSTGDLLDDYSYGVYSSDSTGVTITLSSMPDRVGRSLVLDHEWSLVSCLLT